MAFLLARLSTHLLPERQQEYTVLATNHESMALPAFRSEATNITEQNCAAVFAFSRLVIVYAMAAPHPSDGVLFVGSGGAGCIPEWLHLFRGTFAILQSIGHWIERSPLRPF